MTTCPARLRYTPDRAAYVFARHFPRFGGVLDVCSTQPAGKRGRYLKDKTTRFYVAFGLVRKTLTKHLTISTAAVRRETYRNGICPVCGQINLQPVIGWAFDPAGLSVEACPACLNKHHLRPDCTRYLTGVRSPLATADLYRVDVTVDIRAVQAGYNTDWTITWPRGASEPYLIGGSPANAVSNAVEVS